MISFNEYQKRAIHAFNSSYTDLATMPSGSGKTTLINTLAAETAQGSTSASIVVVCADPAARVEVVAKLLTSIGTEVVSCGFRITLSANGTVIDFCNTSDCDESYGCCDLMLVDNVAAPSCSLGCELFRVYTPVLDSSPIGFFTCLGAAVLGSFILGALICA